MIVCFSGTGNSAAVARRLADELGETLKLLSADELRSPDSVVISGAPAGRVVWVSPVHSWGLPPVMAAVMRHCRLEGDGAAHSLVLTMGDDCALTADQWRAEMDARGWDAWGTYGVRMPNTYVCFPGFDVDSEDVMQKKLADMPSRVHEIAARILAGERGDDLVRGSLPWVKSKMIYPGFVRSCLSAKKFRADGCVGCGVCAKVCPTANITIRRNADGSATPVWGEACTMCLACYHNCPHKAISRGPVSRRAGQYRRLS